jgi:hypothetical protein
MPDNTISEYLRDGLTLSEIAMRTGRRFCDILADVTNDREIKRTLALLNSVNPEDLQKIKAESLEDINVRRNIDAINFGIIRTVGTILESLDSSTLYHQAFALKELISSLKAMKSLAKQKGAKEKKDDPEKDFDSITKGIEELLRSEPNMNGEDHGQTDSHAENG